VLQTLGSGACGAFFQKALAFEKKIANECGILMPLTIAVFFTFFIAKKVTKNLVLSKAFSGRKP